MIVDALLSRPRLVLGVALLASVAGMVAWTTMPREEDPRLAERFGLLVAPFPGADAEQVERLVVAPLEDELAEVDEVRSVRTTIRASVAILQVELEDSVDDTDTAWDRVEDAMARAHRDMPEGARTPSLEHDLVETESVVLAVRGTEDVLALADAAEALKRALLALDDVAEVEITGDPGEQVVIELDEATALQLGLPPEQLAQRLAARNVSIPGGAIRVGDRRVELRPEGQLATVDELARTPIVLPSGAAVPLASIARVQRMPAEPRAVRARLDGRTAVFVGAIPSQGIDAVAVGQRIREVVADFGARHPELTIDEVAYQPQQVDDRLSELGVSLLLGIGIVALVLFVTMGPRLGTVVASVVPLVTFASLAIYATGGGVLHQMAVAALVLALGLLVDNAIVMAEAIQGRLDEGQDRAAAVRGAVRELAVPLASATGTTLASFVPMLLAPGPTGDFTRAIPIVVMTTLAVSYVYAVAVTPLLGGRILKPATVVAGGSWVERVARRIARFSVHRPALTLAGVGVVIAGSAAFAGGVQMDFFPASDRAQLVVSVELPEGAHLDATDDAARRLERALAQRPEVHGLATVVGRSAPAFYYNLPRAPSSPHLAQIVVTTGGPEDVSRVRRFVRAWGARELPDATLVPRRLEQGPPVVAPIEIRLEGDDLADLHLASEAVQRVLRGDPRAVDVRADQGPGAPLLSYVVDDAAAERRGVARAGVALAMLGRTEGLSVGAFRGGDDPVPIVLRAPPASDHAPAQLDAIGIPSDGGLTPLGSVTTSELRFAPAVIHHRDRARVVSILAEVEDGATYAQVVQDVTPALDALDLPAGVHWSYGGAIESSAKANTALASTAAYGAILLVVILLAQFDSVRRLLIVLVTAPLAVMGIWPGLFAMQLPFGFVALLGAIALIGIVVNGAIVLLDLTEVRRGEGASIAEALEAAVVRRTRPILLTTATTVAGLTPLLFSRSTLWPPMASAMISGLTVATVLTLFAVPALYRVLFRDPKPAEVVS
ncbi:MAG: efflux RND transporter permease subunit [Sandaracinaceae bacterium]|nr:efflux RND transporter permease subunit [Sandaracinaceae bacterium]